MKFDSKYEIQHLLRDRMNEHIIMFENMIKSDVFTDSIKKASDIIYYSLKNAGAVYLCGNGGSAADSQHIAAEFVSRFYKERRAINAEALTVNMSCLTAIGNDYDYDRVFERQIEAKGKAGDVLIGISTSGRSKNVMRAFEYASNHEIQTILLTGDTDNKYDTEIINCIIKIPSVDTPRIQEGHIFVGHLLAEYIESKLFED